MEIAATRSFKVDIAKIDVVLSILSSIQDIMNKKLEKPMVLNLDIHNIIVLKRMYELRNVRLVAEALGKTSGAISKNLSKIRSQLNDPLFVQTKNGFEPTSFLEANLSHFEQILSSAESIKSQDFSPETLTEKIIIYAHTLFWDRFGSMLYFRLKQQAPKAKFTFLRWGNNPRERMINGENAVAIHYFDEHLPSSIVQKKLGVGKASFVVRKGHPARDFESLVHYPNILFKTEGWNDNTYPLLNRLKNIGINIEPIVEIDHPSSLNSILVDSDLFSITLCGVISDELRTIDFPKDLKLEVNHMMSFRRSQQNDPLNLWLFEEVQRMLAELIEIQTR